MRWLVLVLALAVAPAVAMAARNASLDVDTEIRSGPGERYGSLGIVKRGARVTASNQPTEGYYKVRTADGRIGWLRADSLILGELPSDARQPQQPENRRGRGEPRELELRVFGAYSTFAAAELNTMLKVADAFKSAIGYGGEIRVGISGAFSGLVRVEKITRGIIAVDGQTEYDVGLSSLPVTAGPEGKLALGQSVALRAALLAGVGVGTKLASNAAYVQSNPFTWLVKLGMNWEFARKFGLFLDLGYRGLKTKQLTPDQHGAGGNGEALFRAGGSSYLPTALDMGGAVVSMGIGARL